MWRAQNAAFLTITVALVLSWLSSAATASTGPVRVAISQSKKSPPLFELTVRDQTSELWSAVSDSGFAVVVPRRKLVLYCENWDTLVARNYDGQMLWKASFDSGPGSLEDIHAGGNVLLIQPFAPVAG